MLGDEDSVLLVHAVYVIDQPVDDEVLRGDESWGTESAVFRLINDCPELTVERLVELLVLLESGVADFDEHLLFGTEMRFHRPYDAADELGIVRICPATDQGTEEDVDLVEQFLVSLIHLRDTHRQRLGPVDSEIHVLSALIEIDT